MIETLITIGFILLFKYLDMNLKIIVENQKYIERKIKELSKKAS